MDLKFTDRMVLRELVRASEDGRGALTMARISEATGLDVGRMLGVTERLEKGNMVHKNGDYFTPTQFGMAQCLLMPEVPGTITCPCGRTFISQTAYAGHRSHCKEMSAHAAEPMTGCTDDKCTIGAEFKGAPPPVLVRPDHYHGLIQPLEYARLGMDKAQVRGFLKGNVMKYLMRYERKNGLEDLHKAATYLSWLIELEEGA